LLEREARAHSAGAGEGSHAVDAAAGDLRVFALGEGEHLHVVPLGAQHLQEPALGKGGAPLAEEGVGGEEEDSHGTPSPATGNAALPRCPAYTAPPTIA